MADNQNMAFLNPFEWEIWAMNSSTSISQAIRQNQKLIMSFAMQQAFQVLQMPLLQLSKWLENEIEQNPLFEVIPSSSFQDLSWIQSKESLYQYLEREISLHFEREDERALGYFLAGSLNEKGFLTLSKKEICEHQGVSLPFLQRVLKQFHQIEPIGLGAQDVRESLLLQLASKGKKRKNLYLIIDKHFDDLIHSRFHRIAKTLHLSIKTVRELIQKELKQLDLFPGLSFNRELSQNVIPDLIIKKVDDHWSVELYEEFLPSFYVHPHYVKRLEQKALPKKEREFIRRHLASGKWLLRTLNRRKKILIEIGLCLLNTQLNFLEGLEESPALLTRREASSALELSESTIARAIAQKYVFCPRGLIPLNRFFSHPIQTESGEISSLAAKNLLFKLIQGENKKCPFSDRALSEKLSEQGIFCARRTITKYRKELNILSCYKRKKWD